MYFIVSFSVSIHVLISMPASCCLMPFNLQCQILVTVQGFLFHLYWQWFGVKKWPYIDATLLFSTVESSAFVCWYLFQCGVWSAYTYVKENLRQQQNDWGYFLIPKGNPQVDFRFKVVTGSRHFIFNLSNSFKNHVSSCCKDGATQCHNNKLTWWN